MVVGVDKGGEMRERMERTPFELGTEEVRSALGYRRLQ